MHVRDPKRVNFDKAAKRVLAPFVKVTRKGEKPLPSAEENEQFSYYLEKKPSVLLRDLTSFLSDSVDLPSVLHETADVLKAVTKAAGVTLYLVNSAVNEIYMSEKNIPRDGHYISWSIREGSIVAAFVANRMEYVMLDDLTGDERFPQGVGYGTPLVKSVLCVPVVTPDGDCFAVIELFKEINDTPFQKGDLKIVIVVTGWMGAAIHQNRQRLALQKQQELNDYLLDLTKCYFADTAGMEKMITEIVKFAKLTLGAERGSFFVIDRDSDELVADLFDEGIEEESGMHKKNIKIKFGKDRGIAGVVARTGLTVNVKDAYNDPRFNKDIDQKTGFITRSILCMPIMGVKGILGVVQVVNKLNGGSFSANDENLFKTFAVYCALALRYTQVHTDLAKTQNLNNIYRDLLQIQLKPCIHDFQRFIENPTCTLPDNFNGFSFYISPDLREYTPQYCLHMILSICGSVALNIENTMKFILEIKKLYRANPYHNFDHALCVCHCMYNILIRNPTIFTHLEMKSLVIAALCHDVDHPGFTNNFLLVIKHDLSQLYEESILENHHFFVTMLVLKDCKIYENVTDEEFRGITKEIREAILATDLMLHFRVRSKLSFLTHERQFDMNFEEHRSLMKAIMMTGADLSGQCKPFVVSKKITDNLYTEFYNQGDHEKSMDLVPLSIMDREKQQMIPEDQVQFLNVIVIPCMDLLKLLLPNTEDLHSEACQLRKAWQEIIETRGMKVWRKDESYAK